MRAFIAVDIPYEIREKIVKIQKEISESGLFNGKLTEPKNLHLTLKFLGEIDEVTAEKVQAGLKGVKLDRFRAKINEIGVFSESFVRIIWLKIDGNEIIELQKKIDEKLGNCGFEKEARFMSHLTIARVKNVMDKKKLFSFLSSFKLPEMEFEIDSFVLKKSELTRDGPIYAELEKF